MQKLFLCRSLYMQRRAVKMVLVSANILSIHETHMDHEFHHTVPLRSCNFYLPVERPGAWTVCNDRCQVHSIGHRTWSSMMGHMIGNDLSDISYPVWQSLGCMVFEIATYHTLWKIYHKLVFVLIDIPTFATGLSVSVFDYSYLNLNCLVSGDINIFCIELDSFTNSLKAV